jgi:hypothetical protein
MYVKRNNEVRSCNHYCSGSVFAVLGIQHATRMRRIVMCGLSGSKIYYHIIS